LNFCIRVDDFGYLPGTPKPVDKGLQLAQRFHEVMSGLPYIAGVIPACLDADGLKWLATRPIGLQIALHGWDHRMVDGVDSEFRGLDGRGCRDRIASGQQVLNGIGCLTEHFIPPFNAIEPLLPEACYFEGIRYIWGAPSDWPTPPQPHPMGSLMFVPSWKPLYAASLWQIGNDDRPLSGALQQIFDLPGKAVITLHITWEAAKCADFRGLLWLIDLIGDRVISPAEHLGIQ
jgi:hypothetical protein